MNKMGSILSVLTLSASLVNPIASALSLENMEWWSGTRLYVGVDMQIRRMDYKGGFGDNLLKKHSPQSNFYGGLRFNSCLGIELGYDTTRTRTRESTLTTGDILNGNALPLSMSPATFKSKSKISGAHADLVGFYPFYEGSPTQLLGAVGVSVLKGTFERRTLSFGGGDPVNVVRAFSQRKAALRLTAGLEYQFLQNFGSRLTVGWVNTSKMLIGAKNTTLAILIKPKNSIVYGLGFYWIF